MSEFEVLQLVEMSAGQLVVLVGQIIAINFAMIVGIYYFLHRAGVTLKLAAFALYCIGAFMFLMLAVRESTIMTAGLAALEARDPASLGSISRSLLAFGDEPISLGLNIALNASFWALLAGVFYLLFFWRRPSVPER